MKRPIQLISLILLCLYIVAVGFLCLMKPDQIPSMPNDLWGIPLDKIAHFIMFFPFPVLAWFSLNPDGWKISKIFFSLIAIILTGAALAIGTEYLQKLSEYRTFDLYDFYADLLGMTICWLILCVSIGLSRRNKVRKKKNV